MIDLYQIKVIKKLNDILYKGTDLLVNAKTLMIIMMRCLL